MTETGGPAGGRAAGGRTGGGQTAGGRTGGEQTAGERTGRERTAGELFTSVFVGFAHELRGAGLAVGTGDVLRYLAAMEPLDPTDLVDLYWAGRATLVHRHDDEGVYDRVFRQYFLGEEAAARDTLTFSVASMAEVEAALVMPGAEPGPEGEEERPALGWMASDVDAMKHRSFGECTPEELAALRRIMTRMRLTPPRRRTRRTRPAAAAAGTRSARDDPGVDADGWGAAGAAVLPAADDPAAAADPDPRRVRVDGGLLPAPASASGSTWRWRRRHGR